ncbi:hypothetical protein EI555_019528 [Monodon monoceros]|uniref:Transmembrane protein 254 n=1 Tax=Monodon monoceros TaxID=40151 RepID=A0A4U1FKY2_MONMO|nr:hypothetical protein EI555_019528 [Monodon monoceros]
MGKAGGDETYFQRSSLFWVTVITLSFGYYTWVIFWPEAIPYQSLGPLGPFTQYLLEHHHTLVHSWSKGITNSWTQLLWFLQTFLFGMASLYYLIDYRPRRHKQT